MDPAILHSEININPTIFPTPAELAPGYNIRVSS